MGTISIPADRRANPLRSKRLLAVAGDERLVEQIRRGNEAAFEVAFDRYSKAILSFCRHMLGSQEEAEDAVQHTFASAHRNLQKGEQEINLKPWLYTIARNRCLSMLRARREQAAEPEDIPTAGLHEQVQQRADLQELLGDLRELPEDQRAALLLSEAGDLSHVEVAGIIGCEPAKVKALVFRARTGLIQRRDAREIPCNEIREQLSTLKGGSLRRSELRHHVAGCPGCLAFREDVKRQRAMLAIALPVTPSLGLKSSVLAAVGLGGGAAGGGGAVAGGAGLAAAAGGGGMAVKIAAVAVLAGGGAAGGKAVVDHGDGQRTADTPRSAAVAPERSRAERSAAATERRKAAEARADARAGGSATDREERAERAKRARRSRRAKAQRRPGAPGEPGVGIVKRSPKAKGVPAGGRDKKPAAQPKRVGGGKGKPDRAPKQRPTRAPVPKAKAPSAAPPPAEPRNPPDKKLQPKPEERKLVE